MQGPGANNYFGPPPHEFVLKKLKRIKLLILYKYYINIHLFGGPILTWSRPHMTCHAPALMAMDMKKSHVIHFKDK